MERAASGIKIVGMGGLVVDDPPGIVAFGERLEPGAEDAIDADGCADRPRRFQPRQLRLLLRRAARESIDRGDRRVACRAISRAGPRWTRLRACVMPAARMRGFDARQSIGVEQRGPRVQSERLRGDGRSSSSSL